MHEPFDVAYSTVTVRVEARSSETANSSASSVFSWALASATESAAGPWTVAFGEFESMRLSAVQMAPVSVHARPPGRLIAISPHPSGSTVMVHPTLDPCWRRWAVFASPPLGARVRRWPTHEVDEWLSGRVALVAALRRQACPWAPPPSRSGVRPRHLSVVPAKDGLAAPEPDAKPERRRGSKGA